jgi:hypothetical protein
MQVTMDCRSSQQTRSASREPPTVTISNMVACRVSNGGARNLVIRSYNHVQNEQAIPDDIHNLVVIKVDFCDCIATLTLTPSP